MAVPITAPPAARLQPLRGSAMFAHCSSSLLAPDFGNTCEPGPLLAGMFALAVLV